MRTQALSPWSLAACAVLSTIGAPGGRCAERANPARPNILIILADDMGFSDIGCYGGEIRTPVLDSLAARGLRFTQFYNTARCCPTRACLMTGLYPHQAGVGHMMEDKGHDGYRGQLNRKCRTIAEVLRPAGYSTYMAGKWHVTRHIGADGPKEGWPLQRGFERFFGTIHGGGSYFDPVSLTRDNTRIAPDSADFYYTDAISDHAARFVHEHDRSKPFFLYVAYTAPHWPLHARAEDIEKYKGVYDKGWDELRASRYKRMVELGIVDPRWALSPRDKAAPPWEKEELKEWQVRCMEVYAAMIDRMDQGIGRIVRALEETGQLESTLLLFLADNGGCAEGMGRAGEFKPRPADPSQLQPMQSGEFQTDMIPKRTRDGYPVRQGRGVVPGPADTFLAYGLPWANASNTPFREYKHWVHEGGISTPLIVHWPGGVDASRRGKLEQQPAHLIDIMATCVDLAGATYPAKVGDQEILPLEGTSLRPAFAGAPLYRSQPIFWEHEGNRAVRLGKWKLVAKHKGAWELHDMEADRSELVDVAEANPEKVKELAALHERWAERCGVIPWEELHPGQAKQASGQASKRAKDGLPRPAFPGKEWAIRTPADLGMDAAKLEAYRKHVGGRGCVTRRGYMVFTWGEADRRADVASACKPLYTHFLLAALEEGKIASLDDKVAQRQPGLSSINEKLGYKDREITWRHLANQVSCYGAEERPGEAYDYNDHNMALFFDTLFLAVHGSSWKNVDGELLHPRLTDILQCQDNPTFMAFGVENRPGRLGISPRDFARFGLLYLRGGKWRGKQILQREHVSLATSSPLSNKIPRTGGKPAEMIPGQRSLGGGGNQCDHLGSYSYAWWTNGVDRDGKRHWPDAPLNAYGAFGHGGIRAMVILPGLGIVTSWNDSRIKSREAENEALRLLVEACAGEKSPPE